MTNTFLKDIQGACMKCVKYMKIYFEMKEILDFNVP